MSFKKIKIAKSNIKAKITDTNFGDLIDNCYFQNGNTLFFPHPRRKAYG